MKKNYAFSWDWKEQPDMEEIFQAVNELIKNGCNIHHHIIEIGGDQYGQYGLLLTTDSGLSDDEAYEKWNELLYG